MLFSLHLHEFSYYAINYVDCFDVTLLPWNIEMAMLVIPFYVAGY